MKLNKEKMKLHLSEIKNMGHILTTEGVKPEPATCQIQKTKKGEKILRHSELLGKIHTQLITGGRTSKRIDERRKDLQIRRR